MNGVDHGTLPPGLLRMEMRRKARGHVDTVRPGATVVANRSRVTVDQGSLANRSRVTVDQGSLANRSQKDLGPSTRGVVFSSQPNQLSAGTRSPMPPGGVRECVDRHLQQRLLGHIMRRVHEAQDFMASCCGHDEQDVISEAKKRCVIRVNEALIDSVGTDPR